MREIRNALPLKNSSLWAAKNYAFLKKDIWNSTWVKLGQSLTDYSIRILIKMEQRDLEEAIRLIKNDWFRWLTVILSDVENDLAARLEISCDSKPELIHLILTIKYNRDLGSEQLLERSTVLPIRLSSSLPSYRGDFLLGISVNFRSQATSLQVAPRITSGRDEMSENLSLLTCGHTGSRHRLSARQRPPNFW